MKSTGRPKLYVGLHKDVNGGLTPIGRIIRDAWVFELIPESENCEGWPLSRIDSLQHQVNAEWDKYGCLVSYLPPEIKERHQRIHDAALEKAREQGWEGEDETRNDS